MPGHVPDAINELDVFCSCYAVISAALPCEQFVNNHL